MSVLKVYGVGALLGVLVSLGMFVIPRPPQSSQLYNLESAMNLFINWQELWLLLIGGYLGSNHRRITLSSILNKGNVRKCGPFCGPSFYFRGTEITPIWLEILGRLCTVLGSMHARFRFRYSD